MKHSPKKERHAKRKAIREANAQLETSHGSEELPKKWPYHVDSPPAEKPKRPKKRSKHTSTKGRHERLHKKQHKTPAPERRER